MAEEPQDQRTATSSLVINGAIVPATSAAMKAASPGGTVFTFASTAVLTYRNQHLLFRKGVPYQLDAPLRAALSAAGITPLVA